MPENEIIPDGEAVPETAREKFERERLSRRQALKRLGMTSAMAAFALFSVDDLARMVGKAMQQRAGDNKVAMQIAKELRDVGVTMAAGPGGCVPSASSCASCVVNYEADANSVMQFYSDCMKTFGDTSFCLFETNLCQALNDDLARLDHCVCHCVGYLSQVPIYACTALAES